MGQKDHEVDEQNLIRVEELGAVIPAIERRVEAFCVMEGPARCVVCIDDGNNRTGRPAVFLRELSSRADKAIEFNRMYAQLEQFVNRADRLRDPQFFKYEFKVGVGGEEEVQAWVLRDVNTGIRLYGFLSEFEGRETFVLAYAFYKKRNRLTAKDLNAIGKAVERVHGQWQRYLRDNEEQHDEKAVAG